MPVTTTTHSKTGLRFSRIGFGGAPLGDLYRRLDDEVAVATVIQAIQTGVTLIDTSPLYGHGLSEARIGTALRRSPRDGLVLSTKVGRVLTPTAGKIDREGYAGGLPFSASFDYSYDGAMRSIEQSLLRLGTDRVEIALIHDIDIWTHGAEAYERRFTEALNGAYRALDHLRQSGAVGAIGIGVNEAEVAARFASESDIDVVMLAGRYTLLEQGALDSFLPLATRKGIGVLLGGVFNSGILATGATSDAVYNYGPAPDTIKRRVAGIYAVCRDHSVSLPHAAIRFPLGHPAVVSIVLGAVSPDEVARNLAALEVDIPSSFWTDLVSAGLMRADAPLPTGGAVAKEH